MKRRDVLGGFAAMAALGLAGCKPAPAGGEPQTLEPKGGRALRLGCDPWAGYYPAVLGERDGRFAAEGLTVSMERPTSTDRMLAEFQAGRFDLIAASLGDVVPLAARDRDIGIVLTTDESAGADQVFQRRDFDPDQTTRVRVGTDLNGFGELFMRDFLAANGWSSRDVQWLHVDAADVGQALDAGQIDVGNCWEPFASAVAAAGHQRVFDSSQTPALVSQVLVCKRRLLIGEAESMRGFCRAWFATVDAWLADPATGSKHVESALGLQPGEASLEGIRLHTLADNQRLLQGSSPALAPVLQRYVDFHAARGQSPGDLSFLFRDLALP